MLLSGGGLLAEMIKRHDVDLAFGMGGFQLLPYYDGIRKLGIRHILINDERTGAFAADAASRITGKPGVCDATLGPGAINLATALAESTNAGVPLIAITGDAHRGFAHRNMTQETRQLEALRPLAKDVIRIENVERIPEFTRRAFSVATSGRCGPVILDLPEDISHAECEIADEELFVDPATVHGPARRTRPAVEDIAKAARFIEQSKRPIILAGGGVHLSGAQDALLAFAQKRSIPVAHTLSGKGALSCAHPLSVGLFGRFSRIADEIMEASDCIIVVGCKLGEIATKRYTLPPKGVPLIHLDIAAEEIGRWAKTDVSLWGDAKCGLQDLTDAVASIALAESTAAECAAAHEKWRATAAARYASNEQPINVARIIGEINNWMPNDGILVADGGFASHWAGLLFDTKRAGRSFIADRGMASIGYGLPGSLGAQLAAPGRAVVGLTGDGGFNMAAGDLETAKRAGAGFTLIVLNNAASGYVKALQHSVYGPGHYQSSDLLEINYADVARAYGCYGQRIENPKELARALKDSLVPRDVPLVLDVVVTRDPAQMLPGVDSRTLKVRPGDRPV